MKTPKGILLDMDNTLYNYDPCHLAGLEATANLFFKSTGIGKKIFISLYYECKNEFNSQLNGTASSHNRLLYFQRLLEKAKLPFKSRLILDMYDAYWHEFIQNISLYDGVIDFLEECLKTDIKIAIVTDLIADIQIKKVCVLGIDNYINALVTSEEAGAEKPRPQLFLLALYKLALTPDCVWVVGDSPEKDIAGGNSIGSKTILFDPHNKVNTDLEIEKANHVVQSFMELRDMLKGN